MKVETLAFFASLINFGANAVINVDIVAQERSPGCNPVPEFQPVILKVLC